MLRSSSKLLVPEILNVTVLKQVVCVRDIAKFSIMAFLK